MATLFYITLVVLAPEIAFAWHWLLLAIAVDGIQAFLEQTEKVKKEREKYAIR